MDENLTRGYCQLRGDSPSNGARTTENTMAQRNIEPPRDRCSCIYLALVLCGAGFLLPYNSFITAVDYYHSKFPDTTIIFDMSLTYICIAFVGVVLNNLLVELLSLHTRITFGYVLSFLMLLFIGLCDVWLELFDNHLSYHLTLVAMATVAFGCTIQQSSFYGYTSMLPRRYTQAVMTGESAAGLIVSINRILTKAMLEDKKKNTIIFFSICVCLVLASCIVFHISRRSDFVRYYVTMCENAGIADDQRGITRQQSNPEEVDILDGNVYRENYGVLVIQTPTTPPGELSPPHPEVDLRPRSSPVAAIAQEQEAQVKTQGRSYKKHITTLAAVKRACWNRFFVARSVWPYMLSIGFAYFVTLCLFPGIESEVVSCSLGSWMPVILISTFNLFDFIGKIVASVPYDWPRGRLVLCTLCRIVLVPLLMLCADPRQDPVLSGEGWPISLSLLLGLTNGYFGSVPMIIAPGKVPDEQKELTGNIMTLSYSIGLTSGSAIAYALDAWLGPHLSVGPCNMTSLPPYNATTLLRLLSDLPSSRG